MNNQPSLSPTTSQEGYRSEAGKRRFTLTVGILAAACFVAQFILPMIIWITMMPTTMMFQMNSMTTPSVSEAALWEGALWYTESGMAPTDIRARKNTAGGRKVFVQ